MNIYISNLDTNLKSEDLRALFSKYGEVKSVEIAMDAFTDKSRGFGHLEMPHDEEAREAISELHHSELSNRTISVQVAEPKEVHKGSYKVGDGAVNVYKFKKN
jgi:RNA recognition motif-containing protein